jgi:hypothetical protein
MWEGGERGKRERKREIEEGEKMDGRKREERKT